MVLSSLADTESLGQAIGRMLKGGEVLALIGMLGAGKTALVRGIAAGLGVPSDAVSSPTFVLAHEYQGRLSLIHIDLYRVKDSFEAQASGLSDCFTDQTVVAIEWADRFPAWLPTDRLEIKLTHRSPRTRGLVISAGGAGSSLLLDRITQEQRQQPLARTRRKILQRGKASPR
jgi:tRNA threonylcarbamoyladenosine biosynthesis protein TsaE